MSSEVAGPVGFVAHLPEHWENNSLLGAYAAIGRFNLCRAYDIAKFVERLAPDMKALWVPSTTPMPEVLWRLSRLKIPANAGVHPLLEHAIVKAREDLRKVPLEWQRRQIFWCPECMRQGQHKAVHQHRSLWFCPEHQVRLEQFCHYCGDHNDYRVLSDREPFYCRCGSRLDGAEAQVQRRGPRSSAPSVDVELTCSVAERVWIAGLPWEAGPTRPLGLSPLDVRIRFAESMRRTDHSPQSRVLGRYFRFLRPWEVSKGSSCTHDEAISRLVSQVRTIAMMSGHACINDLVREGPKNDLSCPCGAGFGVWLSRSRQHRLDIPPWSKDVDLMAYEGSHLGVCLSVSWLGHVQAQLMGQNSASQIVQAFWDLPVRASAPSPRYSNIPNRNAFISHTFQWTAIRCPHVSGQVARLGERVTALGDRSLLHVQAEPIEDARWIMDQLGIVPRG